VDEPAPVDTNTAVTSAKVEAPTSDTQMSDEVVCDTASDEATKVGSGVVLIPTIELSAVPPKRAPRAHAVAAKTTGTPALRAAIAAEVTSANDQVVAPEPAPDQPAPTAQVTTTSATVPAPAFAPARVAFENRLSGDYKIERFRFLVDGAVTYDAAVPGTIDVAPGPHVVEVIADYRMHDALFTYVDDYRLQIRSTEVVPASRVATAFVATARPTGGVTAPMNKRAALAWRSFPAR
jgi:hypothetical protein